MGITTLCPFALCLGNFNVSVNFAGSERPLTTKSRLDFIEKESWVWLMLFCWWLIISASSNEMGINLLSPN